MELIKGKVEQISIKEPQDGQYGRWANYGIKVSGAWHNGKVTEDKYTKQFVVKDKDHKEVAVGAEVEFVVTETVKDGKTYVNIDPKTMTQKGSQAATQPAQQPQQKTGQLTTTAAGTAMKLNALDIAVNIAALELRDSEVPENLTSSLLEKADKIINWANK